MAKENGKPMTADVKTRLKAIGDAKRGIRTFSGYDRTGLATCLDAVLAGDVSCPVTDRGAVWVRAGSFDTANTGSLSYNEFRWKYARRCKRLPGGDPARSYVAWCRLTHAGDAELAVAAVFPWFWVRHWSYRGPDEGQVEVFTRVFPAPLMFALVRAMWPAAWPDMVEKYLAGYTAALAKLDYAKYPPGLPEATATPDPDR